MANKRPPKDFFNFVQISLGDKAFGNEEWRANLNLKDYVLESGGQSREAYARGMGVEAEEAMIDTVQYNNALNYDFIIGTKDQPNMKREKKMGRTGTANTSGVIWSNIIEEEMHKYLKDTSDNPDFSLFDPRKEEYDEFMKFVSNTPGVLEELWSTENWKNKYKEAQDDFGSK
tara:strand:+ start:996 stop:1514 length:519 start_codon:yes stop_codon:yes gene_type:complete